MPESNVLYGHKLEKAKGHHAGLKSGNICVCIFMLLPMQRNHVNEAQKNCNLAVRLWGDV